MVRRMLLVLAVLSLFLATVGPALADKPDKAQGQGAPTMLKGKAFQGVLDTGGTDTWKVDSEKYGQNLSVKVAGAKVQWPGNKIATLADFKPGDRVAVKLKNKPQGSTANREARAVHLIPGQTFVHFSGELTGVDGKKVTVRNAQGQSKEFTLADTAQVKVGKERKAASVFGFQNLPQYLGRQVTVVARIADNSATALVIHGVGDDDKADELEKHQRSQEQENKNESDPGRNNRQPTGTITG